MIIIQFLAVICMIVLNTLAATLPLNGISTKVLSDSLTTLITPAGFTFGIWSLIYLGIIVVSIGILIRKITLSRKALIAFIISSLANGLRIVAWHYHNLHLSMIIIVVLLGSLIAVDRYGKHADIQRAVADDAQSQGPRPSQTPRSHSRVRTAFLVYFGRVQIATLLMTTIYLQYQLHLIDAITLPVAIITLILAGITNILVLHTQQHAATTLVALRALRGIAHVPTLPTPLMQTITIIAWVLIIGLIAYITRLVRSHTSHETQ
jgi:translocator protein